MVIALMQRNEFGVPAYALATLIGASWTPGGTVRRRRPYIRQHHSG
jgi:hypothetical protein